MTQGPACSLACAPATVLRNYLVDMGTGQGQTEDCQINNLAGLEMILENKTHRYFAVKNGYTSATRAGLEAMRHAFAGMGLGEG